MVKGDENKDTERFPPGRYDEHGQQVDLRRANSWTLQLDQVNIAHALCASAHIFLPTGVHSRVGRSACSQFPCSLHNQFTSSSDAAQVTSRALHTCQVAPKCVPQIIPLCLIQTDRFIINVSSVEGEFYHKKTSAHPHTNMAKVSVVAVLAQNYPPLTFFQASLNMMTRTAAPYYARSRIWMNAVDTGWCAFPTKSCSSLLEFRT